MLSTSPLCAGRPCGAGGGSGGAYAGEPVSAGEVWGRLQRGACEALQGAYRLTPPRPPPPPTLRSTLPVLRLTMLTVPLPMASHRQSCATAMACTREGAASCVCTSSGLQRAAAGRGGAGWLPAGPGASEPRCVLVVLDSAQHPACAPAGQQAPALDAALAGGEDAVAMPARRLDARGVGARVIVHRRPLEGALGNVGVARLLLAPEAGRGHLHAVLRWAREASLPHRSGEHHR